MILSPPSPKSRKTALPLRIILQDFREFARPDRIRYVFGLLLMLLGVGFDLLRPLLLKQSLDQIALRNVSLLQQTILLFLTALFFDYFSKVSSDFLLSASFLKTIQRIRQKVFHHVLGFPMSYWDQQPVGSVLTRVVNDTESLRETLNAGLATMVSDVLTIGGVLIIMLQLDLHLTPIVLLGMPVVMLIVRFLGTQLQKQFLAIRVLAAKGNAHLAEAIQGMEVLQIFGQEKTSATQYGKINEEYRQTSVRLNIYDAMLYAFVDCFSFIMIGVLLYVGFGIRYGITEITTMIVYLNLLERVFIPIRDLSAKFTMIQQSAVALDRIFSILHEHYQIPQGKNAIESTAPCDIIWQDVSFRYRPDSPEVLQHISFSMSPGQTVALVGPTGSGKSTVAKLLLRGYDGYTGQIHIAGIELRQLNYHSLRQKIAVIPQEIVVFPGSLRDNITLFRPDISDEQIQAAIALVQAEQLVAQLPQGLNFVVKENGHGLSLGQLQLIAFARALVANTPVIVMDEATAYVDTLTEIWVQQAIAQILRHKTVLIIAHRLATVAAADQILVIQQGQIIQQGSHAALLQQDGYYRQFYVSKTT